jgi:Tfp pilus assembly pilus retraction ATPase PilT
VKFNKDILTKARLKIKSFGLKTSKQAEDETETISDIAKDIRILDLIDSKKSNDEGTILNEDLFTKLSRPKKELTTINEDLFYLSDEERKSILGEVLPDVKFISSISELNDNYILDDHAQAVELSHKSNLWYKYNAIVCENLQTGDKAIGLVYPFLDISAVLSIEEFFFIGNEIIHYYSSSDDSLSILYEDGKKTDKKGKPISRVQAFLELMERRGISDLHIFLGNSVGYIVTARITSNTEFIIKEKPINPQVGNEIVHEFLKKAGQEKYNQKYEYRGLIKEKVTNSKGGKTTRTFRVHIGAQHYDPLTGYTLSLRRSMTYYELKKLDLRTMGYVGEIAEILEDFLRAPKLKGSVVVSGETNSGKSTFLFKLIELLGKKGKRILSVENPIEIQVPGIVQMDLKKTEDAVDKVRMTVMRAIAFFLSHDPDICLINEVRFDDEISSFIDMALKGHLGLTTMHANDIKTCIFTIMKATNDPLVVGTFRLFVNQMLVDLLCPECNGTGKNENEKECPNCNGNGKKGKIALPEVLYFYKLPTPKDDVLNFKELQEKGIAKYVPRLTSAQRLYDQGLLAEDVYETIKRESEF